MHEKCMKISITQINVKLEMNDKPIVVHLKRKNGQVVQDCDVYIGRAQNQGGWRLSTSIWANEFSIKKYSREESLELYKKALCKKILSDLDFWIPQLKSLKGKKLGCWCAPLPCHGNVISDLVEDICAIDDTLDNVSGDTQKQNMDIFLNKLKL